MIVKIVLSLVLVFLLGLIGFLIGEKHKRQMEIFDALILFNKEFLCDISIFSTTVLEKIEKAPLILQPLFSGALSCLKKGEKFNCDDVRLTKYQKILVSNYVNLLGTSDSANQFSSLSSYEEKLKIERDKQKNEHEKNGKVYAKLGVSLGLVVVILLF